MSFNNLKISRKLGFAFVTVVATIVAMCAAIFWNLTRLEAALESEMNANRGMTIIGEAQYRLARQENSYRGFLLTNDDYYLERLRSHRSAFNAQIETLRAVHAGGHNEAAVGAQIEATTAAMDAWQAEIVDNGVKFMADPIFRFKAIEMIAENGVADRFMQPVEAALGRMMVAERAQASVAVGVRQSANALTATAIYAGVGLAALISILLGYLLSRTIASPVSALTASMGRLAAGDNTIEIPAAGRKDEIGEMAKAVLVFKDAAIQKIQLEEQTQAERSVNERHRTQSEAEKALEAEQDQLAISSLATGLAALSEGDLSYRITADFSDKTQKLKDDFNRTAQRLQDTMARIAMAVGAMRNGTGEISQAADDLSRRTEQQAASVEETAAALDEITATVRKTADGAHQASEVTALARAEAVESGAVVRDAVTAMAQIEKSSQQIGQIIGVIDEIAFQTNLLALNAGVEAARAGDAGRGFAVVASEVRALAQRSAEAAKEIKSLISMSTNQVDQGVEFVGKTGVALDKIVAQVAEITGLVTEIAASAREQSIGLAEVNTAVNQMDQATQQNAAMVEQSTTACRRLAGEASDLASLVSRFRLGRDQVVRVPEPAAQRAPAAASASFTRQRGAAPAPGPRLVASGSGVQASAFLAQSMAEEGWEEF